jgi:serine/threonine-protein kinase
VSEAGPCLDLERLLALSCGAALQLPELQHLQRCPECAAQLQELRDDEAQLASMRRPAATQGDFGEYRILKVLGEGGMSRVYSCCDSSGQPVAVKVCREPRLQAYFEAEARLLSRCLEEQIPGILPLLGSDLSGLPAYLVLPICAGGTLAEKLAKERRFAPRQVWQLAKRLGAALAGLQRVGIVHGDLKPENILLDARGEAWIADLGTARQVRRQEEEAEALRTGTRPEAITAAYMSPEQARGGSASSASDVFCLGLILYEAASGRHPCGEGTNWEIVSRMLASPIPELAKVAPQMPQGLAEFIMSCLEKDPRRRPPAATLARLSPKLLAPPGLWRRSRLLRLSVYALLSVQALVLLGIIISQGLREDAAPAAAPPAAAPGRSPKTSEPKPPKRSKEVYVTALNRKDLSMMAASLGLAEKDLQGVTIKKNAYQHYLAFRNQDHIRILVWDNKEWQKIADFRCTDTLYVELQPKAPFAEFLVFREGAYWRFKREKKGLDINRLSRCKAPPDDMELLFPPRT